MYDRQSDSQGSALPCPEGVPLSADVACPVVFDLHLEEASSTGFMVRLVLASDEGLPRGWA